MTLQELRTQIRKRAFHPVYYFYGEEDYLIEQEARVLADAALGDGDASFNLNLFWATETKAQEIIAAANAFPFLSEKRVVIVRDADRLLGEDVAAAYVQNPAPDTVFILTAAALPKSAKRRGAGKQKKDITDIVAYLKSPQNRFGTDVTVEFKRLREPVMALWIKTEFQKHGKAISPAAIAVLQALKSDSTREIAGEIEKMHLALPDAAEISEDDVYSLLGMSKQYNLFQLSDAVFERNTAKALEILSVIASSEAPTLIVYHLSKQLAVLWQARYLPPSRGRSTDEEARSVGVGMGWQLDNLKKFLPNFRNPDEFERLFEYLLEADLELKSQSTDPFSVLSRLVYQLTTPLT